jgi:ubiquinone/menaquinone biosynthesis C-methylase UbiE
MRSNAYVLEGGDRGADRLRLLADVKWPTTKPLLERAGLRPGMSCLDVGCGIGAVTLQMAEAVGKTGRTTGIDFDERYLGLARAEAERRGLTIDFRTGNIGELDERDTCDFVFARFLLTHLSNPDQALRAMSRAARPGGVVVVEDIQFSAHFSHPQCPAFDRYVRLYENVVEHKGGDPNIGPHLLRMMLDAGLQNIELEVIQPTYRHGMGKHLAAVTMEHIREAVVAAGLASNEEVGAIVNEISAFADDSTTLISLPRIFQVWGIRP